MNEDQQGREVADPDFDDMNAIVVDAFRSAETALPVVPARKRKPWIRQPTSIY